jgi:hypothetical protein
MLSAFNKEIDFAADAIYISLHTSTFAPNQDTMDYQNDLTNELGATGGYTTGGKLLATCAVAYDAGTNVFNIDATVDPTWTSATFTAHYAVVYDSTPGTAATNPLICYIDFGADVSVTNGTFTIQFAAGGIAKITVS